MKKRILIGFSCLVLGLMLQGNFGNFPSSALNETVVEVASGEELTKPTELPSEH
ncbi:hypothetical protein [Alkalihalobacterium chitinilyticum]|uniref:Phr family secreted Rap phosphatase inhibitor n=1 Tax=Alkalihalobacterium chitinilyticum TaxID=2980103 RepID=A0ABT5VHK9_9BACI|nr:hypothetical protein [Alkalihalobacterium chitinilyticum]MDE5414797.1 hypothetical protein [Alkalihalobacterium chitinilyticum]